MSKVVTSISVEETALDNVGKIATLLGISRNKLIAIIIEQLPIPTNAAIESTNIRVLLESNISVKAAKSFIFSLFDISDNVISYATKQLDDSKASVYDLLKLAFLCEKSIEQGK